MTTEGQGPSQPPGPGWWLASDGNWYPPQQAAQQPVQQPAYGGPPPGQPKKSNRGCMIALAIGGALLLGCGGVAAFVIWQVADTVEDVVDGVTVGDVECPTEGDVSDLIGYDVTLATSGSIVIASGCTYTSTEGGAGAGVQITSGSGLIADEVLADLETAAENAGAETSSIDVGDDGKAFGSDSRSQAATKADGKIVEVEIFSEGTDPIGDKQDEAVEILEDFIELNED
jgi:hypothetical protein